MVDMEIFIKRNNPRQMSLLNRVLKDGGPGYCQFAITDACNARCGFCNFSIDAPYEGSRIYVSAQKAHEAIGVLADNGVGYIAFVGGEPTMHGGLPEMISYSKSLNMNTLVCTNGMFLTPERVEKYVSAGLDNIIISIDAPNSADHENNRGMPGVCERIAEANNLFQSSGVTRTASVTISRLLGDLTGLPEFLNSLNFDDVTFSYPLRSLASSYKSYSDSDLLDYSDDELIQMFELIKEIKRSIHVVNPTASLSEMQRFLRGEEQIFPCLGGCKYFYLDWHFDLYRCHAWHEPMCNVFEMNESKLIRDGCTKCMIDCYRDSSVLHYLGMALYDARQDLAQMRIGKAASRFFNKSAYYSGKSVLEGLRWIRKL